MEGSLRIKEMLAVSPILREFLLEEMEMVGAMVSTLRESCKAAMLLFPAASEKVAEETSKEALELLLGVGVKVAE